MTTKQYCRYCAFCHDGDAFYCGEHEKVLSEAYIKTPNRCPDYVMSDLGDVETGRKYQPRREKPKEDVEQMRMEV